MATNPRNKRLYIRRNSRGQVVPGSDVQRRTKPKVGDWIDITNAVTLCCNGQGDSYIIFTNGSTHVNITSISFPGFSWSGTLANGGYLVAVIPNGYDESITVDFSVPSADIDVVVSTVQGGGVIHAVPNVILNGADPASSVITTTGVPNSTYLVSIIDD